MAKVSNEAKTHYNERIQEYKKHIEEIWAKEKTLLLSIQKDDAGKEQKNLILVGENLNIVSYYLLMNAVSVSLLGLKNEAFLNDGRKACYKAIIYLENVVTPFIDMPFQEIEEKLEKIEYCSDLQRYELMKKMGFAIDAVIAAYGDNTKWKWSFVELEARFAVVAKNLINFKTFLAKMDPRVEDYPARMDHLNLVRRLLQQAADAYRQKYEISTLRMDDFRNAILYLSGLRRIQIYLGEREEAEALKKKIDIWNAKMESDDKQKRGPSPAQAT